ncbi:MAG: tyrosine-protein phosphatase [Clostridia bacterium]|nr:tyrosine-protein phosphatase [Clostridia bacterium]
MITLKKPLSGAKISLVTPEAARFLSSDRQSVKGEKTDWLNLEKREKADLSVPAGITFEWDAPDEAQLMISQTSDFEKPLIYTAKNTVTVYNLKCDTYYYWKVICKDEVSRTIGFITKNEFPRMIKADGITNVRDCGGYENLVGKVFRQGMIYRGSELNSHVNITPEGLRVMSEELGIKTVLDLRGSGEDVRNVYGKNYVNIPAKAYDEYILDPYTNRKIFEFLANKENYPIYFHCWGGADRTGTVAFLLGAVLWLPYEVLLDDYEVTSLSVWGIRSRNSDVYKALIEELATVPGQTLYDKTANYMAHCGISPHTLDTIRSILLR